MEQLDKEIEDDLCCWGTLPGFGISLKGHLFLPDAAGGRPVQVTNGRCLNRENRIVEGSEIEGGH